jgi:hypothetical protein
VAWFWCVQNEFTCILGQRPPGALAVLGNIAGEYVVLLRSPPPPLQPHLLTARRPPHRRRYAIESSRRPRSFAEH